MKIYFRVTFYRNGRPVCMTHGFAADHKAAAARAEMKLREKKPTFEYDAVKAEIHSVIA